MNTTGMFEDIPGDVLREIIQWTGTPMTHSVVLRHTSRHFAKLIPPTNYRASVCERIAETPYTALMDWAIAAGYTTGPATCTSADEAGNLDMLKHLRGLGFIWDASLEDSAWRGHLEIIQYGVENGYPAGMSLPHAAEAGHLEICKFIYSLDPNIDDYTCLCAAKSPHSHIVRWIIEVQPDCSGWLLKDAYIAGNLKIVKVLGDLGYYHYGMFKYMVQEYGDIDMIKWYAAIGAIIDGWDALEAAECGHLHFLEWFKEIGVVINYDECIAAAETGGHAECVKWLRENR